MSKLSRSSSVEIVPPSNSRGDLAGPMNSAFNNHDDEDELRDDDADAEAEEEEETPSAPVKAASSNGPTPTALAPCERCVRTGKTCKGVAGVRCEHCKRLKQKCSNSTGPARGKPSTKKLGQMPSKAAPRPSTASTSQQPLMTASLKRKSPGKVPTPLNGDVDGHSIDGEGSIDEEANHEPPPRPSKKRRIARPSRAQLVKAIESMEASVKRIQSSVAKEVDKMEGVIKSLHGMIKDMDEE